MVSSILMMRMTSTCSSFNCIQVLTCCSNLVKWLWSTLIQNELDELKERFNSHVVRFDKEKKLPSGASPNNAYVLHEKYGVENYLQLVDKDIVAKLMEELGGEHLIRFVSVAYAAAAQEVFDSVGFGKITFLNV